MVIARRGGKADLHVHTTWSDGAANVLELLEHAVAHTDLDVIAVTDHDTIGGGLEAQAEVRRRSLPIEVVVGEEVSTSDGHVLGLFLREVVEPGRSAAETVAQIHAQGGLAVAAHPFFRCRRPMRSGQVREGVGWLVRTVAFDAVETLNGTPCLQVANLRARRCNRRHGRRAEVGGSDAHILAALGKSHTLYPGKGAVALRAALERCAVVPARAWYAPTELAAYAAFYVRLTRARRALATG